MKNFTRITLMIVLALSLLLAGCSKSSQTASTPMTTSSGLDGKALLETRCATCHSLSTTTQRKKSKSSWERVVQQMVGVGAQLNTEEQTVLVQYLADNYK
ncbi:MAG: hypothetical protein NTZ74_14310 [Chloroflexi bacterium]|nr:hypothetical protein [Chloroflexota bacterium]